MPKLDKRHLLIIGGGVALVLLFMYMRSRSAASSPADTIGTPDNQGTTASDYANLAGGLQSQGAQESSDIADLTGQQQAAAAQEAADVSGLAALIAGIPTGSDGAVGPAGPAGPAGKPATVGKTGKKHKTITDAGPWKTVAPHVNQHHPAGTAGSSVAARHHGVHGSPGSTVKRVAGHPATHQTAWHPAATGQTRRPAQHAAAKAKPPKKPVTKAGKKHR